MRKLYLSIYLLGLLLFFLSFFGNTIPIQMTDSTGSEVKVWGTAKFTHISLALNPLFASNELMNVINVPSKYTHEKDVYRYEDYLNEAIKRVFCSIPASVGWFTIIISFFLIRKIWKQTVNRKGVRYFLRIGSVFTLVSVPILTFDFYNHATTYNPYFHLGIAAYLIVLSYLFIGVSLLNITLSKKELS